MIVKVSMPTGTQQQARVTTKDGKINMKIPAALAGRRFADKAETLGFFSATLDKSGILEIGDRVDPTPEEKW